MMDDAIIKNYADKDARLDGAGSIFQAFKMRLTQLARDTAHDANTATKKFHEWAGKTNDKFTAMAGNIPDNSDIFINDLTTKTEHNFDLAQAKYSNTIIHLGRDKHRWGQRFGPSLEAHLDEPPQKNAFLLTGFILFLLMVESVANSQFFAEGSEFGLLGGTLTAFTVSLGNVFIPLGLAFFGHRWFYTYDSKQHTLGLVIIGLFILWAVGFNLLIAQYRESLLVAAGVDSSNLNYVLLFALGAAVAGISFWKMWSFLDPYKQARKCINDLQKNCENFRKDVCTSMVTMQDKFNTINRDINCLEAEIIAQFTRDEANFTRVHAASISETNSIFASYWQEYCPMKIDPDPEEPIVTLENAQQLGVGIADAERQFFDEMKTLLESQVTTATQQWILKLHDVLKKISDLIRRFHDVIVAKLADWRQLAAHQV